MICCSSPHPVHPSASNILPCSTPSASPALFHCLRIPRHCGGFCRVHFWAWKETWVLGWTGSCRMEFLARFGVCEFCSFAESAVQTNAFQSAAAASPKDRPHPLQGLSQLPKHSYLLSSVTCSSQLAQIIVPGSIFLVCGAGFSWGNWSYCCSLKRELWRSGRIRKIPKTCPVSFPRTALLLGRSWDKEARDTMVQVRGSKSFSFWTDGAKNFLSSILEK